MLQLDDFSIYLIFRNLFCCRQ